MTVTTRDHDRTRGPALALVAGVLLYGVGDTATSAVSMLTGAGHESNPMVLWFVAEFGVLPGLVANKALAVALSVVVIVLHWRAVTVIGRRWDVPPVVDRTVRYLFPALLIAVGTVLTVWNTHVILT